MKNEKSPLVLDNEALVRFILKGYAWRDDYEDLLQEGRLALFQATKKFDPTKGKFSSFAGRYIRNSVLRVLRAENREKRRCPGEAISLNEAASPQDGQTELLDLLPDERVDVEKEAMARLMLDEILPGLESRELRILLMRTQGYGYCEIAEVLGLSRQRVQQLLHNIGLKYEGQIRAEAKKGRSRRAPASSRTGPVLPKCPPGRGGRGWPRR
jgi:RNA polymerase sporulation-specific sigma factor